PPGRLAVGCERPCGACGRETPSPRPGFPPAAPAGVVTFKRANVDARAGRPRGPRPHAQTLIGGCRMAKKKTAGKTGAPKTGPGAVGGAAPVKKAVAKTA